jgi:vacuolar-type H+-ATPase subunit I/STV1
MNVKEKVKNYQNLRQMSIDYEQSIQQSAVDFFQMLNSISVLSNKLPNEISYRKQSIQQLIMDIVQSTDRLQHELNLLNVDCSIQIHGLIIANKLQKLNEEKHNARKSNAKLAKRTNFIRSKSDSKNSTVDRQNERTRRKSR